VLRLIVVVVVLVGAVVGGDEVLLVVVVVVVVTGPPAGPPVCSHVRRPSLLHRCRTRFLHARRVRPFATHASMLGWHA